jgi:hypothetical protein
MTRFVLGFAISWFCAFLLSGCLNRIVRVECAQPETVTAWQVQTSRLVSIHDERLKALETKCGVQPTPTIGG